MIILPKVWELLMIFTPYQDLRTKVSNSTPCLEMLCNSNDMVHVVWESYNEDRVLIHSFHDTVTCK
jgi:hypothetical protein